jgi:aspartyl aminopeptidase
MQSKNTDLAQCFNCKEYGHFVNQCPSKYKALKQVKYLLANHNFQAEDDVLVEGDEYPP